MRTSLYSILCIVIRFGAVLFAFTVLSRLAGAVFSWQDPLPAEVLPLAIGSAALSTLIAFLLWLYPGPLARLATGRSAHEVFEAPLDAREIQWIALSVLGMYFVMSGLIDLSSTAYRQYLMSAFVDHVSESARRDAIAEYLFSAVQIALGLALAFGARGLVGLLHRLRHADVSKSAPVPPHSSD